MYINFILLSLGILLSAEAVAQERPEITFGRVSDADRNLASVPDDSTASAYVLFKELSLDFEYSEHDGPSLAERHHRRVKLLNASAFDRADVVLEFNREYENIAEVEAVIHLPGGGSILVRPDEIIEEQLGNHRYAIKFTFPRVEPGAIIEYRYLHRSKHILIPTTFYYQEDIPVRWAQYRAMVPPYYGYVSLSTNRLHINETKVTNRAWGPLFGASTLGSSRPKIGHSDLFWAMRDLPATRNQPYSNNAVDYLPQVRLQLQNVQYPARAKQTIFSDWAETAANLDQRDDFGKYYRKKVNYNQVWKVAEPYLAGATTDRERIQAAYDFVNEHFRWNGKYGVLATDSPDRVFRNQESATAADLNIALLALLNEAGVEASPLLVSLRNTGAPIEQYPIMAQFNHLMVYTEVEGTPMILDAGAADRPPGLPRQSALNHRAWVADRKNPRWVDVEVPASRLTVLVDMELDAAGAAKTTVQSRMEQYFAFEGRGLIREIEDGADAPLVAKVRTVFPGARVVNYEALESKVEKADQLDYKLELEMNAGQSVNDFLYVQPVILPLLNSELADVDVRSLPIDFSFPWQQRYITTIHLPEGYFLEEMPPATRLRTEDGSMVALYSVSEKSPGLVQLTYSVKLDRTLYSADEYSVLRDMYRRVIELQQTPLVLKRAK